MKQEQFLNVLAPDEARRRWHATLDLGPLPAETVGLGDARDRVLAEDVIAPGNVPAFDRSNVDGFAVRAEDTFGASERDPAHLRLVGGSIDAGHAPEGEIRAGEARAIATGAVVPRGADAVVMVEDTETQGDGGEGSLVAVSKPVVPGGRISAAGSDLAAGELVLRRGTRLTARETGTLAACGIDCVRCVRRPRVGILSTGDEIVPPGRALEPGQVHDANATLLADAVRELGGVAVPFGIAPDETDALRSDLREALTDADVLLLSGGTSKGGGDLTYQVLAEHAEIVVHGVALKPGKPLCLATAEGRAIAVLPGFPTSAIFTFHAFVAPVLHRLLGRGERPPTRLRARLPRHVASEAGREEYNLVNLVVGREGLLAFPLGKGSGSVTTFTRADGFFVVPASVEYLEEGAEVEVTRLGREVEPADLVIVGSNCTGLGVVLERLAERGLSVKVLDTGSTAGLTAAREGACDIAPIHLYDRETGAYNEPFVEAGLRLLPGYGRQQGIAWRRGTPGVDLGEDGATEGGDDALRRAAASRALRIANRNPGSGTRVLVEDLLPDAPGARPAGWASTYRTHGAVAAAIAQGRADWGVCLEQAARAAGLAWRPLREERYDFLIPEDRWAHAGTTAFREALADADVRDALQTMGFRVE